MFPTQVGNHPQERQGVASAGGRREEGGGRREEGGGRREEGGGRREEGGGRREHGRGRSEEGGGRLRGAERSSGNNGVYRGVETCGAGGFGGVALGGVALCAGGVRGVKAVRV